MSKHIYCTYLTVYFGTLLPRRYIGYSTVSKIQKGYNGSVSSKMYRSIYLQEQKNNKHLFKTRILSTFNNKEAALEEELRLHQRYDVVKSSLYMNRGTSMGARGSHGGLPGSQNPMFGAKRPSEWRKRQSNMMKGNTYGSREWTEEEKLNKSIEAKERAKIKCSCLICFKVMSYYRVNYHYILCIYSTYIKYKFKRKV